MSDILIITVSRHGEVIVIRFPPLTVKMHMFEGQQWTKTKKNLTCTSLFCVFYWLIRRNIWLTSSQIYWQVMSSMLAPKDCAKLHKWCAVYSQILSNPWNPKFWPKTSPLSSTPVLQALHYLKERPWQNPNSCPESASLTPQSHLEPPVLRVPLVWSSLVLVEGAVHSDHLFPFTPVVHLCGFYLKWHPDSAAIGRHPPARRYRRDGGQTAVLQARLCLGCHLRTSCCPLSLVSLSHCTASLALPLDSCTYVVNTGTPAVVKLAPHC